MTPHTRVPYHGPVVEGAQDRDNFVRNLLTILEPGASLVDPTMGGPVAGRPLSPSVAGDPPVLTLDQIKLHCHIELDQTAEDDELLLLERAARIHTQNKLRRQFDADVGENTKLAMLVLIAHWYRNREAIVTGTIQGVTPLAYDAILISERDFPEGCY
jgi:Phage gp6-like head-tail connector protein